MPPKTITITRLGRWSPRRSRVHNFLPHHVLYLLPNPMGQTIPSYNHSLRDSAAENVRVLIVLVILPKSSLLSFSADCFAHHCRSDCSCLFLSIVVTSMIEHEASPVYSKTYQASLVELNLVEAGIGGKGRQRMTWDLVSVLFLGSNMRGHFILQCKDSKCWTQATYTSRVCFSVSFASFVRGYRFGWC